MPAPAAGRAGPEGARTVEAQLQEALRATVAARGAVRAGKTEAAFASLDAVEDILERLVRTLATPVALRPVNSRCPIMGTPIDPAEVAEGLTRFYGGKRAAFCCSGCSVKWDALSDSQKQAARRDGRALTFRCPAAERA